ncbi:hypothetical protein AB0T78_003936 [Salmonella enterica]|nr:hypothetical protein [Salmonella enterica]EHO5973688.1 hypothetical protein [Salmonella enterica]HDC2134108.1 hypothetical protein [Salmonella enterica]
MKVNNYVLVRRSVNNIGYFKKVVEFPAMPPIGAEIFFNTLSIYALSLIINNITFSELTGEFSLHFDLDIENEELKYEQPLSDEYFPRKLVKLGFQCEWLEDKYESILSK